MRVMHSFPDKGGSIFSLAMDGTRGYICSAGMHTPMTVWTLDGQTVYS